MDKRGFSLVEVAVAIGVMAILAGTMAPLALRVITRQREEATRRSLRVAFEAMFGSRERSVPNMRADFGFDPAASLKDLPELVAKPIGYSPFGVTISNQAVLPAGWNGPYWQGPVSLGVPVDAWGQPLSLLFDGRANTYQVRSPGPPGRNQALVYPPVPVSARTCGTTLVVVVIKVSSDIGGELVVYYARNCKLIDNRRPILADASRQELVFKDIPARFATLNFHPQGRAAFSAQSISVELEPGVVRFIEVRL